MTKTELLLGMADAYDPIPLGADFAPDMASPAALSLLDMDEYEPYLTPTGMIQLGYQLTQAGRAAWSAAREP